MEWGKVERKCSRGSFISLFDSYFAYSTFINNFWEKKGFEKGEKLTHLDGTLGKKRRLYWSHYSRAFLYTCIVFVINL